MINKIFVTVESDNGSEQFDITDVVVEKLSKKKKTTTSKIEESDEPIVRLGDGKLTFTTGAISLLGITPGEDQIEIKYPDQDPKLPYIGKVQAFGLSRGSKVSAKGSVIFKGSKHDTLAEFGQNFILVPSKQAEGVFAMTQDGTLPEIKEIPQPEEETTDDNSDLDDLLADENINELTLE